MRKARTETNVRYLGAARGHAEGSNSPIVVHVINCIVVTKGGPGNPRDFVSDNEAPIPRVIGRR